MNRLSVIDALAQGPKCMNEIVDATGMKRRNIISHLRKLEHEEIIIKTFSDYDLTEKGFALYVLLVRMMAVKNVVLS